MNKRTIVANAFSPGDGDTTHAVIWVSDKEKLMVARAALRGLRELIPDAEEISFKEGDEIGVRASFGYVNMDDLKDAEGAEATEIYDDNHWVEIQDPEAPVASLQETLEENFGSVRVHVQDDCFYVTAMMEDTPVESVQIPY